MPDFEQKTGFSGEYDKFQGLIEFYGKKLNYDDATAELSLFFFELMHDLTSGLHGNFENDEKTRYIAVSIRNEYYRLAKKRNIYVKKWAQLFDDSAIYCTNIDDKMLVLGAIKELTRRQRKIINMRYFMGLTDIEISQLLGISRQAINRLHNRALDKMKSVL